MVVFTSVSVMYAAMVLSTILLAKAAPTETATPTAPNAADTAADPAKAMTAEVLSAFKTMLPASTILDVLINAFISVMIELTATTPVTLTPTPTPPGARARDADTTADLIFSLAKDAMEMVPSAVIVEFST